MSRFGCFCLLLLSLFSLIQVAICIQCRVFMHKSFYCECNTRIYAIKRPLILKKRAVIRMKTSAHLTPNCRYSSIRRAVVFQGLLVSYKKCRFSVCFFAGIKLRNEPDCFH